MPKSVRNLIKVIAVAVFIFSLTISPGLGIRPQVVQASLQDELREIEDELAKIRNQKGDLQSQIDANQRRVNGYSGEIGKLQAELETLQLDVAELELEIEELEVSIKLLERQIDDKEKIITLRLEEIGSLEEVTSDRLRSGYRDYRLNRPTEESILTADDINEYFKASQYRQLLQKRTNEVMLEVVEQKAQLEYDQEQLAAKKIQLAKDKEVIEEQRSELKEKQAKVKEDMNKYYGALYSVQGQVNGLQNQLNSMSEEEARKQAEAERIRQAIFNSFNPIGNGTYVVRGTMIGRQGATGLATGPHVHFSVEFNGQSYNPCQFVPAGRFGNCGGNGTLSWPLQGTFYYTSGYGSRCISGWGYCSFHRAIDIAHPSHNAPVFAAHDGYLYKGVDSFGALYIIICEKPSCRERFKTGYWHLSSY